MKNSCATFLRFLTYSKYFSEVVQEMRRLLGQDKKQPLPSTNKKFIQSKALVGKPLESSSQSCISSESVADCQSSRGDLVEDRRSKEYSAIHCSQNLVEGDNSLTEKKVLPHQTSNSSSSRVFEKGDGEVQPATVDADQNERSNVCSARNNYGNLDLIRIKETLKKRKCIGVVKKPVEAIGAETNSEAWIESELENGIELGNASAEKKQRKLL